MSIHPAFISFPKDNNLHAYDEYYYEEYNTTRSQLKQGGDMMFCIDIRNFHSIQSPHQPAHSGNSKAGRNMKRLTNAKNNAAHVALLGYRLSTTKAHKPNLSLALEALAFCIFDCGLLHLQLLLALLHLSHLSKYNFPKNRTLSNLT